MPSGNSRVWATAIVMLLEEAAFQKETIAMHPPESTEASMAR